MISTKKIQNSFRKVKKDMYVMNMNTSNYIRYLYALNENHNFRIKELERRINQLERMALKKVVENEF
jgi:hypothetical protein